VVIYCNKRTSTPILFARLSHKGVIKLILLAQQSIESSIKNALLRRMSWAIQRLFVADSRPRVHVYCRGSVKSSICSRCTVTQYYDRLLASHCRLSVRLHVLPPFSPSRCDRVEYHTSKMLIITCKESLLLGSKNIHGNKNNDPKYKCKYRYQVSISAQKDLRYFLSISYSSMSSIHLYGTRNFFYIVWLCCHCLFVCLSVCLSACLPLSVSSAF